MEEIAAVLGDRSRWRIVELLAERPRSVGELAELTGLRQPQTTKHLQALGRVGLVAVFPLGQRRVYALEVESLASYAGRVQALVAAAEAQAGDRDVLTRYQASLAAEAARADRARWADGRTFTFERLLPAPPSVVWRHWVDPALLVTWWAPPSMRVSEGLLEPRPGGRAVLEYEDADGRYRSEGTVHAATEAERLTFDLAVAGATFTSTYDVRFVPVRDGTRLTIDLTISDSSVESAQYIAGIETGWNQVLDNLTRAVQGAQS